MKDGVDWLIGLLVYWFINHNCHETSIGFFERPNFNLKTKSMQTLKYSSLVLIILGLTGLISEAGPPWARYATLGLGLILLLLSFIRKSK